MGKALITLWAGYWPMAGRYVSKRGQDGAQCSSWQRQKALSVTSHLPQNLWPRGDIGRLVATPQEQYQGNKQGTACDSSAISQALVLWLL